MTTFHRLFHGNPEFIRNVWLEISPQRLIVAPVLIALVAMLSIFDQSRHIYDSLSSAALTCFVLATVLWGAKLAGDTLTEEFTQGT